MTLTAVASKFPQSKRASPGVVMDAKDLKTNENLEEQPG